MNFINATLEYSVDVAFWKYIPNAQMDGDKANLNEGLNQAPSNVEIGAPTGSEVCSVADGTCSSIEVTSPAELTL